MPKVDSVECDGQEEAVDGDGAAGRVAAHDRGEAAAVAPVGRALVAYVDDGGEGLEHLFAEADEQEQQNDDRGKGLVELQLHVCGVRPRV